MLDDIKNKIEELKELDLNLTVFGADSHQYLFNSKIDENELCLFEEKHNIAIPKDYRIFLKKFGNGGCGPDNGLFRLEVGIYDIPLNIKQSKIIALKNEFRFESYWNLEGFSENNYDVWEDEYDQLKWSDGMLRIGHLGCGIYSNLVLNGKEKGNIWIDSRTNENGIYPANYYNKRTKNDFLSWYLYWLESSIKNLKNKTE
jgi:hypothetical protein